MRIRRRRDELERRLDSERPQPPDEFVSRLTGRLTPAPVRRRSGWSIALAASFTTLLVTAFALTGGIGYAAGAAKDGTTAVTSLVSSSDNPGKSNEAPASPSESAGKSGRQRRQVGRQLRRPASRTQTPASRTQNSGNSDDELRQLGRQLRQAATAHRRDRAHRVITSKPYAISHPETRTTPTRSSWTTAQCPTHLANTATPSGRARRSPGLLTTSTGRRC